MFSFECATPKFKFMKGNIYLACQSSATNNSYKIETNMLNFQQPTYAPTNPYDRNNKQSVLKREQGNSN